MRLEPVYAGGGSEAPDPPNAAPLGMRISLDRQQIIGVKVAEVNVSPTSHLIRLSGRIALDETRVLRVTTALDGWIRGVGPAVTGNMVEKDELLATFYSRNFLTAQQTYLYALNTMDRFKEKESAEQLELTKAQIRAAEENLESMGMGDTQMREIASTRQIARDIEVRSPIAGLVLARNAFVGQRFDRGVELFQIADISHVWVLANLLGDETRYVRPGQAARIILPGQTKALAARFTGALPQFDAASRTVKARLELENPGEALRPDMFVEIEFPVTMPLAISVPAGAVIDSGRAQTVYVTKGDGYFQPRMVQTGWRLGDRVEIVKGLTAGEQIVVSGNFLLDSESRMRMTGGQGDGGTRAQGDTVTDPLCGMEVNPAKTAGRSEYKGKTYYFCSDYCKREFDKNPEVALSKKASQARH